MSRQPKKEAFEVVRRDVFRREYHGAHELALCGAEAGAEDDAQVAALGRLDRGCDLDRERGLQNLGAAEEDLILVLAIDVEGLVGLKKLDRLLEERRRLAGEHGLVDNARSADEQNVRRNVRLGLLPRWE